MWIDREDAQALIEGTPENPIYHSSGYTVNMPLGLQGIPGWTHEFPEIVADILKTRDLLGIVIEDDLLSEPPAPVIPTVGFWDDLDEE